MKKLILCALILGTSVIFVPSTEAKTTADLAVAAPQVRIQIGRNRRYNRRWNRRGFRRVVTTTRIRRIGVWTYRETIRTTYLPNGTIRRTIIRRQRLNRWRRY